MAAPILLGAFAFSVPTKVVAQETEPTEEPAPAPEEEAAVEEDKTEAITKEDTTKKDEQEAISEEVDNTSETDTVVTEDTGDTKNNAEEESVKEESQVCLNDNDSIKESSKDDWDWNEDDKKAETKENVKLGVEYAFPGNKDVTVTFKCLPADESKLAHLKIEQINAEDIKLPEGMMIASPYAYDITTDGMKNGDFKYDLSLPKEDGKDVSVGYIEKDVDEVKGKDLAKSDIKNVDKEDTDNNTDTVEASDLDHFTIVFPLILSGEHPKIDICHATASNTNPYTLNNVSVNAVQNQNQCEVGNGANGHGDHENDIIPPFSTEGCTYPGKNWDTQGKAIWDADCHTKGSITIIKHAEPKDAQDFSFTTTGTGLTNFSLDDDSNPTLPSSKKFSDLEAGQYSITETPTDGWQVSFVCTDGTELVSSVAQNGNVANISLAAAQNVTCTFINTKNPAVCGDGIKNENEACDYGSANGSSSCSETCQFMAPVCSVEPTSVTNGEFESPDVANNQWDIFSDAQVPGWSAEWYGGSSTFGSATRPEPKIELQAGVNGWTSSNDQYIELDSDWDGPSGSLNGEPGSLSIYQDLPTVIGNKYTLSWEYAGRPQHSNNRLKVEAGGQVFDSGVIGGGGDNTVDWITQTITFTATNTLTRIRFTETGTPDSLGMFLDNVRLSCEESLRTTDVQVCKVDKRGTPLSGWTLMLEKETIQDNLFVPSTSSAGVNSVALVGGTSYIAKASGTWSNQGGANLVDAEYSTTDGFATHFDGYPSYQDDILELQINGTFDPTSNWGAYNSDHKYAQSFVPAVGGPANFRIFDGTGTSQNEGWFGDNSGNLSVDIVAGYAGITGENGCVTFEDVPYGTYTKNEILQDGWQNVSGIESVTVDSEHKKFTITNKETPKPAKISATKVVCDDESYLPNMSGGANITGSTAADFVALHPNNCHIETDWDFQWDSTGGSFGSFQTDTSSLPGWHTFSGVQVLPLSVLGNKVEVREVFPDNSYVPFTNDSNVSAEIYCSDDVAGYDNWEWITNIHEDTTYHCVAFNAKKKGTLRVVKNLINDNSGTKLNEEDFSFQVNGAEATAFEPDGTNEMEVAPGTYNVTEIADSGYDTTYQSGQVNNCSEVVVPAGGVGTCTITNNDKPPVHVVATKIVCTNEADLPNYGEGGPNITATTAADWIANHKSCSLAPDWQFQWSYDGVPNPGDNTGAAGTGWNTSAVTNGSGQVTIDIPNPDNSPRLWFREINKEAYIPFTYSDAGNNTNPVSAEIYCHDDVLNYDNWDWVGSPTNGSTYYCVAWNTKKTGTITIIKDAINDNPQNFSFGTNFDVSPNPGNQTSFQLDDDNNQTLPNSRTFTLPVGNYTVQEGTELTWKLTGLTCTDKNGSVDLANRKATISLDANEAVVCTFTNTQLGYIKGLKFNDKNADGQWNLLQGELGLGNWRIFVDQDSDQTYDSGEPTALTSNFFLTRGLYLLEGMLPGTYSVCEEMQSGWNNATDLCQSVTLTPGDLKLVNFGNFQKGHLIIDKVTVPGEDSTEFSFGVTGPNEYTESFGLTDEADPKDLEVKPGSYTITETPNDQWTTTVSCDNEVIIRDNEVKAAIVVDENPNSKTIQVPANQTVKCTFTNTKKPVTIVASKIVCENESDLPNWGNHGGVIGENTAEDFLETHPNCALEDGWQFQYAPSGSGSTGEFQTDSSLLDGPWLTSDPTIGGTTTISIPDNIPYNGRIEFREVFKNTDYLPFSNDLPETEDPKTAEVYCTNDVYNYDNWEWINNPVPGATYHCVAWNVLKTGTITGYKFSDIDGNGKQGDNEPGLAGWTLYLDLNNNGSLDEGEPTGVTGVDGTYTFENLIPGNYVVREVFQEGWEQTLDSCGPQIIDEGGDEFPSEQLQLVSRDLPGTYLKPGGEINCTFGNQNQAELKLTKDVDVVDTQAPGDVVIYTLTVEAEENTVLDTEVTDLPPKGFEYVPGSAEATSSLGGSHDGPLELSHEYASPGVWSVGNLVPGETVTLKYQARISDSQDDGLYEDLAYARGNAQGGGDVLANDPTGFVGTQVAVATPVVDPIANIDTDNKKEIDRDTERKTRVLGASTGLPATGANSWILLLALVLLGAGMSLLWSRRTSMKMLFLGALLAGATFLGSHQVMAAGPGLALEIEKPDAFVTTPNFKIGFVALDTEGRAVTVRCYETTGGLFQTIPLIDGGSSGDCQVNSGVMPTDGNYSFYVTAEAEGDLPIQSETVNVAFDGTFPGTPYNYDRDEATCDDKITFTTANDGQTVKVELYRSTAKDFVADTPITTLDIGPNQNGYISTTPPDCNEDYWYALRALDANGNASGFVADRAVNTDTIHKTKTKTTTVSGQSGNGGGSGAIPVAGGGTGEGQGSTVEGATTEGAGDQGVLGEMTKDESQDQAGISNWAQNNKGSIFLILLIIGGILYYFFYVRPKSILTKND